jgi:hypothetical protein
MAMGVIQAGIAVKNLLESTGFTDSSHQGIKTGTNPHLESGPMLRTQSLVV